MKANKKLAGEIYSDHSPGPDFKCRYYLKHACPLFGKNLILNLNVQYGPP